MKISFSNKKLKKLCEDEAVMHRKRPDIEKKLRLRIAALKASADIGTLCRNDRSGKWHRLKEDREGQWAGALSGNMRIIIVPSKDGIRIIGFGEELTATEAIVQEIVDYH